MFMAVTTIVKGIAASMGPHSPEVLCLPRSEVITMGDEVG